MTKDKLTISIKYLPKVLLLGNGINRAYDFASWDELIKSIKTKELTEEEIKTVNKAPNPLQPIILTEDHVGDKMKEIAPKLTELKACDEEENLLNKFVSLPFDSVLTTNYTYEIEKAAIENFNCKVGVACKYRKKAKADAKDFESKQLNTYFEVLDSKKPLWHIHGEAAKPDTMILGHYYYGKLLAKIQPYIRQLKARETKAKNTNGIIDVKSWVDYFMLSDVYIVGLGLDLSELDLWWLINCKKRHFPKTKIVLYKPDVTLEQRLLAQSYNIEVVSDGLIGNDYKSYYNGIYTELKKLF